MDFRFFKSIRKAHLRIYLILIGFSAVLTVMLKLASGHRFHANQEEKFYVLLYGVIFLLSYAYKLRKNFASILRNVILVLFLICALITVGVSLKIILFAIRFNYESSEVIFIVTTLYVLPALFLLCNLFLFKSLVLELKENNQQSEIT